ASSKNKLARYKAELRAQGEKLTFKEVLVGPTNVSDSTAFVRAANLLKDDESKWAAEIKFEKYIQPGFRHVITATDPVSLHSYRAGPRETNWSAISSVVAEQETNL